MAHSAFWLRRFAVEVGLECCFCAKFMGGHCDKKWEGRSGDTRERDRMERSDRWWQQ